MATITPSKRLLESSEQSERPFKRPNRSDDSSCWRRFSGEQLSSDSLRSYAEQNVNALQRSWNWITYCPIRLDSCSWRWGVDTSPQYHLSSDKWDWIIRKSFEYLTPLLKLNIDIPDHLLLCLPIRQDTRQFLADAFRQKIKREEGAEVLSFLRKLSFEQNSLITEYSDDQGNCSLAEICPLLLHLRSMKLQNLDPDSIPHLPRSLESVSIGGDPFLSSDDWSALFQRCHQLKSFFLATCDDMDEIIPHLPTSLTEIGLNGVTLTDGSFAALHVRCPHLKELSLYSIDKLTEAAFTQPLPNLDSLVIEQTLDGANEDVILKCTPHLKSLTLCGRWDREGFLAIPDSIQSVDLSCSTLPNETLSPILDRCIRLQELDLSHTKGWTGAAFAKRCLPLEKLYLSSVHLSVESLSAILAACPRLTHLTFTRSSSLPDDLFCSLPLSLEDKRVRLFNSDLIRILAIRCQSLKLISSANNSGSSSSAETPTLWVPRSLPPATGRLSAPQKKQLKN